MISARQVPAILFFVGILYPVVAISADPPLSARDIFVEHIVYRSKLEGTRAYEKKLDMIETIAIEGDPEGVFADAIGRIDDGAGRSEYSKLFMDGLALTPGYVGKTAATIGKVFDLGERSTRLLLNRSKNGSAIEEWEAQLRQRAERIYDEAQTNPKYAEAFNKFLSAKFGDIKSDATALINIYPPFKDSLAISEIQKLLSDGTTRDKVAKDYLARLNDKIKSVNAKLESLGNRAPSNSEIAREKALQNKLQTIEEYALYGSLAARLVSIEDPELGRAIGLATKTYKQLDRTISMFDAGRISAGAAGAGIAMIAFNYLDSLNSGPPIEFTILREIGALHETVIKASKRILSALGRVDKKLDLVLEQIADIHREVVENQRLLIQVYDRVREQEEKLLKPSALLFTSLQTGFNRQLLDLIGDANGWKQTLKRNEFDKESGDFEKQITRLHTFATKHAKDTVSTIVENRDTSTTAIDQQMADFPHPSNLAYLGRLINLHGNSAGGRLKQNVPELSFNPAFWTLAAAAYVELASDWPNFQRKLSPGGIDGVLAGGFAARSFLERIRIDQLILSNSEDVHTALVKKVAGHMAAYFSRTELIFSDILAGDIARIKRVLGSTLPVNASDKPYRKFTVTHELFSPTTVSSFLVNAHIAEANQSFTLPATEFVGHLVTPTIKMLVHMGKVALSCNLNSYHESGVGYSRNSTPIGDIDDNFRCIAKEANGNRNWVIIDAAYKHNSDFTVSAGYDPSRVDHPATAKSRIKHLMNFHVRKTGNNDSDLRTHFKQQILDYAKSVGQRVFDRSVTGDTIAKDSRNSAEGIFAMLHHMLWLAHAADMTNKPTLEKNLGYPHDFGMIESSDDFLVKFPINSLAEKAENWKRKVLSDLAKLRKEKKEFRNPFLLLERTIQDLSDLKQALQDGRVYRRENPKSLALSSN